MEVLKIIDKYYQSGSELRNILLVHSEGVARKALQIADRHPQLQIDRDFLYEAAMLHDIGIFLTNAPGIQCFGTEPYIRHGILGAHIMREEGYERHARVCERHTGTGLSREQIISQNLPLPHRDFLPETLEEQIICFADKFFSKTRPDIEKTADQARHSLLKFGEAGILRFDQWCNTFL